jgi:hypothetical protein
MKLPSPIFACLAIGIGDGLRRLLSWLLDADAALVAVLVILTGVLVALTSGGRQRA